MTSSNILDVGMEKEELQWRVSVLSIPAFHCILCTSHSGGMQEWVIQIPSIVILVSVLFPSLYIKKNYLLLVKPRCACAARAYGSLPVCVSVCLCVCYYNICSTAAFGLKFLATKSCFLGFRFVDFTKSISFKSYGK